MNVVSLLLASLSMEKGAFTCPKVTVWIHGYVPKLEITVIQIERILCNAKLELVVHRNPQEEAPFGVESETPELNIVGKPVQLVIAGKKRRIHLQQATDLTLQLRFGS